MKKHKKFGRKLKLSKHTIVRLEQRESKNVRGGHRGDTRLWTFCGETQCGMVCPCESAITTP